MKHLISKLSAFLVMLMSMSATVQAEIVKHEVCDPTASTRGFKRVCWENTKTGKYYSDADCTQELVDEALAKAVVYAKLPESPISNMRDFHESEHENDWSVDLNWAAVTTFQDARTNTYTTTRYAEFTAKEENVSNARLVWNRSHGDIVNGRYTVEIRVNGAVIFHVSQYQDENVEGVFVKALSGLKKGDIVRFEVTPDAKATYPHDNPDPTFKASLEYEWHVHEYQGVWCICDKCGYIKEHTHNYVNCTCTHCGLKHFDVCDATSSSRGFTRELWEHPHMENRYFTDENCTQELVDEALAKAVVYKKLPTDPIINVSEFARSEHENDLSVDFNWAAVTIYNNAYYFFSSNPRSATFKVTNENPSSARLVWNRNQMEVKNGKYTVSIYVNNEVVFTRNQNNGEEFEGVFVQSLPELKQGDEVKFEVIQNIAATMTTANPTFKACLEYLFDCEHQYPEGSLICSKCHGVKDHEHSYVNHECTICGDVLPGYIIGYVGSNADRKNVRWELDQTTNILTFTGSGEMETFDAFHNEWKNNYKDVITKIVIGEGITTIGDGEGWNYSYFGNMGGLTDLSLPSTLRTIGAYTFYNCYSLKSITLPEGLQAINRYAFANAPLQSFTLPSTLTFLGESAFLSAEIQELNVPASLTSIDRETFSFNYNLTKVIINGNSTIARVAFSSCYALRDFYLMSSEQTLADNNAFVNVNTGNITLHVSNKLQDWAKNTAPWNRFGKIVPLYNLEYTDAEDVKHLENIDTEASDNTFTLTDGAYKNLAIYEDIPMQTLTYTRNFSAANTWQALYVPFNIEITDELLEMCDIAKPYMVATDGSIGGDIDEGEGADIVVLKKMKAGDVANHGTAYYIRPKETGAFQLEMSDVTLYATDATTTLSCATTEDTYEFVGQYVAGKPASGTWYALSGGGFRLGDNESPNLPAMRWYMTKTSKNGSPAPAPAKLRIMTWGEDDTTGIMDTQTARPSDNAIYSLSGVRMNRLQKGINIINGKKIVR